ncbi:cytochrome P450 [Deinococcus cellulosilyticus NBRC 106333 = KACC 11606]|uniref:Cytochrome P450 n=1 Tax=Deinococcus cellulosilyticus (strain DSM 18568 / NBRC 106333 / KACC 11606 / 5516J-15) TaxID=1223518 RepID=A0A511N182_DEIC1|nr:cytochrome P450 [Deinococcus cellulosilyticus NBRC 106333 = KACC 11606]
MKVRIEAERDTYIITHPQHVEEVLQNTGRTFQKGYQRHPIMRMVLGNGLVASEGEFWLRQRRLAQPLFHRQHIHRYAQTMVDFTTRTLKTWPDHGEVPLTETLHNLTMEIITQTVFSVDLNQGTPHNVGTSITQMMDFYQQQMTSPVRFLMERFPLPLPIPGEKHLVRAVRDVEEVILALIELRRQSPENHHDLLSLFLQARDDDGQGMTDTQLRDELITLFLAGHETTANSLLWTLCLLSTHPDIEAQLQDELRTVLNGRTPGADDYPSLTFTQQVVRESLRLYPPVWWMSREPLTDWVCDDLLIPAGSEVGISPWVMHRDPQFYPDPQQFRPHRWTFEFQQALPRHAYFPFGGGPRLCIGNNFALMEMALVLATLLQHFHVHVHGAQTVLPDPSLTLRPQAPLRAQVVRRTPVA